jgi:hypothetical protein
MIRSFSGLAALVTAALLTALPSSAAEMATATISSTQLSPGNFQYNLTLNNTGTTTIGTFWFGWVPGDNFMPVMPTNVVSPAGWQDMITSGGPSNGFAIQWTATSPANNLPAGGSASGLSFDSTLTLAQLEAPASGTPSDPVFTSSIYSGAPFSDAGVQITPTVASTSTPEPSNLALILLGLAPILLGFSRRAFSSTR